MKISLGLALVALCWTLTGKAQTIDRQAGEWALKIEGSNRQIGVGLQYDIQNHWSFPLVAGLCNEFQEKKWNDGYVEIQPHHRFGRTKWHFPLGVVGGMRWMNDYGHRFTAFYGGCFTGVAYRSGRHAIGLHLGLKYGKKRHLLTHNGDWGKVAAIETYRERPGFFTLSYRYFFRVR